MKKLIEKWYCDLCNTRLPDNYDYKKAMSLGDSEYTIEVHCWHDGEPAHFCESCLIQSME